MIVVPTAMIASDAIAAAVFGKETLLEFWINAFFSIAIGLLLKKMYSYMDEFKHPLKVFVRCIIVVAAIYAVIQIIEFIF